MFTFGARMAFGSYEKEASQDLLRDKSPLPLFFSTTPHMLMCELYVFVEVLVHE